ncbi:MAG: alkaline phosphatase family protein [Ignavibacteriaceae bacterium]|jgi:predicted AlkP superfamily pyrophosphatase or phosphodiesterase|nr:alkaline phosphatase family protein [Ignavibacteriaceae bacterium]
MKALKNLLVIFFLILFSLPAFSQTVERPKLVVGIVVDQMRYEYLYRFYQFYGDDGFKRLMNEGSNFTFAHYNYELTSTALGHASIYTGTTPFYHGIIGNTWYDRFLKKTVNCVGDSEVNTIGSDNDNGQKSPKRLLSTTITDQLKLSTDGKSKVISVSIKDRAAILPGGHMPDGAYWYDDKTGNFITSTYYLNELPKWVIDFNNKKYPDQYLTQKWELSLPESAYQINPSDESTYEPDYFNEGKTSFPHSFEKVEHKERYYRLISTPFGNQILAELAKSALINENLGKGDVTDFLAVSFSTPDIIGHEYGTHSYEVMDNYIKLDRQIADLLHALDQQVGKGNYLLFLTADHAAVETQSYLRDKGIPVGGLNNKAFSDSIKAFAQSVFGSSDIIADLSNRQVFLNREFIKNNKLDIRSVENQLAEYMRETFTQMTSVFTRDYLQTQIASRDQKNFTVNGFHPTYSGDIAYDLQPGYLPNYLKTGTSHGTIFSYDTHIPILFYGWNIPAQTINTPVYIVDIAPTIANLLKITEPSASMGIPIIKH